MKTIKIIVLSVGIIAMCFLSWHNGYKIGEQDLCENLDGEMIRYNDVVTKTTYDLCNFNKDAIIENQQDLYKGIALSNNISIGAVK